MIQREALAQFLADFLACQLFDDYAPNGLQVEGKPEIRTLCTAVTASAQAIHQAIELKADALLVHHGFFWRGESLPLVGMKGKRLKLLLTNEINLFAYHLPLDCHLELGNNAGLGKRLAVDHIQQHRVNKVDNLLWSGSLSQPMSPAQLQMFITKQLGQKPLYIAGQQKPIQRIAWCTGAAQDFIEQASSLKVDAYLSGEASERTYYQAQELGIDYFACGHHATEREGVRALGAYLNHAFKLEHHFIDSSNPV